MIPNKKKMLCLMVIVMFMTMLASSLFACRMVMLVSGDGLPLSSSLIDAALTDLSALSPSNPDGWGIVAFNKQGMPIPGTIYSALNNQSPYTGVYSPVRFAGSRQAGLDSYYTSTKTLLMNRNDIYVLMAHIRNASTGTAGINVPNPHPFVWSNEGRYYAFAHNGTIASSYVTQMDQYTTSVSNTLFNSLIINQPVDSGHYFAYMLANLHQNSYYSLDGFKNAMSQAVFANSDKKNFIMSDGYQGFAYRNSTSAVHTLYNNIYTNSSTRGVTYIIQSDGSTTTGLSLTQTNNNDFIYTPVNGRPNIMTFASTQASMKRKLKNTTNWHYESFPILNQSLANTSVLTDYDNVTKSTYQLTTSSSNYLYKNLNGFWFQNGQYYFQKTNGHKLFVPSGSTLDEIGSNAGDICSNNSTFGLQAGMDNWVGYWVMSNQTLAQALGNDLSKVESVRGERWHYDVQTSNSKVDPTPVPTQNANALMMEFGKMYIVTLKEGEASIPNFKWANNRVNGTKEEICYLSNTLEPEYFSYIDKDEYETINIANLDENSGIEELGVYAGEDCIGATRITSYPVQILAYTKGYEGMPLTFRAITNNKSEGKVSMIGKLMANFKDGDNSLVAGNLGYAGVNLYKSDNQIFTQNTKLIKNVSGFPNPFNPTTTIKFSLKEATTVNLEIYNVKGQKVKTLVNQKLAMGTHGILWNGEDNYGKKATSGIYFYKLSTPKETVSGKLLMLK